MVGSSLAPRSPIPVPFCAMDHKKSNFSLIFDTPSVGGCWGQPMSFFWKLVDEIQFFLHPEDTRHHNSIKFLILLPLRADLLYILHYETPCIYIFSIQRTHSWIATDFDKLLELWIYSQTIRWLLFFCLCVCQCLSPCLWDAQSLSLTNQPLHHSNFVSTDKC